MKPTQQRILRFAVSGALLGPACLTTGCPQQGPRPVVNPAFTPDPQEVAAQKKAAAERERIATLQEEARRALRGVRTRYDVILHGQRESRVAYEALRGETSEFDRVQSLQIEPTIAGCRAFAESIGVLEEKLREASGKRELAGQSQQLLAGADELAEARAALEASPPDEAK